MADDKQKDVGDNKQDDVTEDAAEDVNNYIGGDSTSREFRK